MLQPIDELFDQRVDAGAAGIEPDVRLFVCRAALIIQAFEPGAIGRHRTASIGRDTVVPRRRTELSSRRSAVRRG